MSFLSGSELAEAGTAGGTDRGAGALRVPLVDETALSDENLRLRLGVLGRAESTLAAMKSRVLAELSRRHSKGDAQRLVRGELQASRRTPNAMSRSRPGWRSCPRRAVRWSLVRFLWGMHS